MNRTLYFVLGSVCLCLTAIIAAEFDWSISEVAASPGDIAQGDKSAISEPNSPDDLGTFTGEILARPLFTPGRRPPTPPAERKDEQTEPQKSPPILTGRLAGMLTGPHQLKEAFFTRENNAPVSVKEGDEIEGWTVASIEQDRVVLTSEFGERVVQPTFIPAGRPAPTPPKPVKPSAAPARPPQPVAAVGAPNNPRPAVPTNARINTARANSARIPNVARQSQKQ